MAIVTSACERYEKILIVAPSEKQSSIIMNNVIDHFFDSDDLTTLLQFDPKSLERLKQERSKERLTLRNDSEIFTLTADVRTISKNAMNLMGFGATMVIVDEASLIPDTMFAKILRMVGGSATGKLIKLGNTFEQNHFFRSLHSSRYHSMTIPYQQGIAEGRITQEFIDEAREDMPPMDFSIFYECKFPSGGAEDALIPLEWIEMAINNKRAIEGNKQAGLDVARFGRDQSVYALRNGNRLDRFKTYQQTDTMALVGSVAQEIDNDGPEVTAVDIVGIGSGVYDRLEELGYKVHAVSAGESPTTYEAKEKFYNLRAEMYWNLRERFKPIDGQSEVCIPDDAILIQDLTETRYRYSSERKIRIEEKEEMKKRIHRSPDKADAIALAFFDISAGEPQMFIG